MKKMMILWIAVITVTAAVAAVCVKGASESASYEPFRLHIIANSDSVQDQRVKLLVRDAVLHCVKEKNFSSEEEAEQYALSHKSEFLSAARRVLAENGMCYGARAYVGEYYFPTRHYDVAAYEAGNYHAMRIVLGSGGGKNWWCVMFPPLCIVDMPEDADAPIEYTWVLGEWLEEMKKNIE